MGEGGLMGITSNGGGSVGITRDGGDHSGKVCIFTQIVRYERSSLKNKKLSNLDLVYRQLCYQWGDITRGTYPRAD